MREDHGRGWLLRTTGVLLSALLFAVFAVACGPGADGAADDTTVDDAASVGDTPVGDDSGGVTTDGEAAGDGVTPVTGGEPAAVVDSVEAAFDAAGVAADHRIWSLARYPRVLDAGEEVIDWQGQVMATAPDAAELLYANMAPWASWSHPGMLFFMAPGTDTVLEEVSVGWWPVVAVDAEDDSLWGAGDPTAVGAGDWLRTAPPLEDVVWNVDPDVADDELETFSGGLQAVGSGSKCEPTRYAIIVLGQPAGLADLTNDRKANESVMRRLFTSAGFGIADANVKTVEGTNAKKTTSWSDVKAQMDAFSLKCCDEIFFYYTAHGAEPSNNEELLGAPALGPGTNPNEDIITPKNMADYISGSDACKWAIIADSCYSGHFLGWVRTHLKKDDDAESKTVSTFAAAYSDEAALNAVWVAPDGSSVLGGAYTQLVLRGVQKSSEAASEPWGFGTAVDKINARHPKGELTGEYLNTDTGETDFASQTPTSSTISGSGPCCECESTSDCTQTTKECHCTECVDGMCVDKATAKGDPCDDGDKCTLEDECHDGGFCWGEPNKCDDNNSCTMDSCEADTGDCKHTKLAVDAPCDDGDKCTEYDKCDQSGSCKGVPKICEDNDVCTKNACADGECHYPAAAPGTECLDSPPCTTGEVCIDKKCVPTGYEHLVCELDLGAAERPCTTAMCTDAGCKFVEIVGTPCQVDGAPPGTCASGGVVPASGTGTAGKCVPNVEPECTSDNDCAALGAAVFGTSSAASSWPKHAACAAVKCVSGFCEEVYTAADTPCAPPSGDICWTYRCNGNGFCSVDVPATPAPDGCECTPGGDVDVDCAKAKAALGAKLACADVTCQQIGGGGGVCITTHKISECDPGPEHCWKGACTNTYECLPRANIAADFDKDLSKCDDSNGCTKDECVGPKGVGADGAGCGHDCQVDTVCPTDASQVCAGDASSCGCVDPACADNSDCDDGDACSEDLCVDGTCQNLFALCDDDDPCTDPDACDPATGDCVYPAKDCDDSDPCTSDGCVGGSCTHMPIDCADNDACTTDSCDATGACLNEQLDCDDGDLCTTDSCGAGDCSHVPVDCNDGDACTTDACEDATGECLLTPVDCDDDNECTDQYCGQDDGCIYLPASGPLCDDGDPCTTDGCVDLACDHTPVDCDDGDACTDDSCDATGACQHDAIPCDDGDPCTTDGCVAGDCTHTPVDCDDGDACTDDSCDATGTCQHDAIPCDDGDACTTDGCLAGDCTHTPVDCDDSDECTTDSCDGGSGACVNEAIDCDDGDECTDDDCSPGDGCVYQPLNGAPCDDGDECTEPDACVQGVCTPGDEVCEMCPCPLCPFAPDGPGAYQMPQGGWIMPDLGGPPLPEEHHAALNFLAFEAFQPLLSDEQMGGRFFMPEPLPSQSPLPYQGNLYFHDISIAWFGPGEGQPFWIEPPLEGATHMLSVGYTNPAEGWVGHLWVYDGLGEAGGWTLADANVPFTVDGNEFVIQTDTGLPPCTPFKLFSQAVMDDYNGAGQPLRVLRFGTAAELPGSTTLSTNPDGAPIQLEGGFGL